MSHKKIRIFIREQDYENKKLVITKFSFFFLQRLNSNFRLSANRAFFIYVLHTEVIICISDKAKQSGTDSQFVYLRTFCQCWKKENRQWFKQKSYDLSHQKKFCYDIITRAWNGDMPMAFNPRTLFHKTERTTLTLRKT